MRHQSALDDEASNIGRALPDGTALPASATHFDVPLPAVAINTGPPTTFIEMLGLLHKVWWCNLKHRIESAWFQRLQLKLKEIQQTMSFIFCFKFELPPIRYCNILLAY
jgi:hypothetical protein